MRHEKAGEYAYEEEQPPPPVAVALYLCRKSVLEAQGVTDHIESEAIGMATLICGRDRGLTLGVLNELYQEYEPYLDRGHPVLQMALERFRNVLVGAAEDMLERMEAVTWPSEGRAVMEKCREDWGMPDLPPDGDTEEQFPAAVKRLQELQADATMMLSIRLGQCQTRESFQNFKRALDREFPGAAPQLRGRVRTLELTHRSNVLDSVTTSRGWPPRGKIHELSMAVRWYYLELADAPELEDYISFTIRMRSLRIKEAVDALTPIAAKLQRLRAKLSAKPAPPKLLAEGFREDIDEIFVDNDHIIQRWSDEFWWECPEVTKALRALHGEEAFIGKLEADACEWAQTLRDCGPKPPIDEPEAMERAEVRAEAEVSVAILVDVLRMEGRAAMARALSSEFPVEIENAQFLVHYLDDTVDKEEYDSGWGAPRGYEHVERPENPPPTPPPPPPPPPPRPPTPPKEQDIHVTMRLHGVTREDLGCKSEILMLDRCATIIARECGIPREWVTNIACTGSSGPPPAKQPFRPVSSASSSSGTRNSTSDSRSTSSRSSY